MNNKATQLFNLMNDPQDGGLKSPLMGGLKIIAGLASGFYGIGAGANALAYDLGWLAQEKLPVPVVGIGNLDVGGAGKTPLTREVALCLKKMGLPVGVMSRGYGRQSKEPVTWVWLDGNIKACAKDAGDEPYLLAQQLEVPLAVGPDRVLVGRKMLKKAGPMVLVGDDLFQHRRLHRDLDIVILDASRPFGNGHMLPRGPLREPKTGLRRAQALILSRALDRNKTDFTRKYMRNFWGDGPVLACRHKIKSFFKTDGEHITLEQATAKKVLAFCALARPDAFLSDLRSLGLEVPAFHSFADHHYYTPKELTVLWERARALKADALVTTQKDWARLPKQMPLLGPELWVSDLTLEFDEGESALSQILVWGLSKC